MPTSERNDEMQGLLQTDFINGWIPISQTKLSGNASSISFTSISSEFRTLVFVTQLRADTVAEFRSVGIRFNSDTGNNYDYQILTATAGAASGFGAIGVSSMSILLAEAASSRASNFAPGMIYIPGYKLTDREKWAFGNAGVFGDVSGTADLYSQYNTGRWRNVAAVTTVTFVPIAANNFVADSIIEMYGVL